MLIIEYQASWEEDFINIKEVLTTSISSPDLVIEHVGSTAVKGLAAKPIIDIDLVYTKIEHLNLIIEELATIGYVHIGDQGIEGREVFKRNGGSKHEVLDSIRHHLYACHCDSSELHRHLAFRDYLRTNEAARKEYENLKRDIANQANQDKKSYALLKEDQAKSFIENCLKEAGSF